MPVEPKLHICATQLCSQATSPPASVFVCDNLVSGSFNGSKSFACCGEICTDRRGSFNRECALNATNRVLLPADLVTGSGSDMDRSQITVSILSGDTISS